MWLTQSLHLTKMGKNIIKGATQISGHFLKLHFCTFEKSLEKQNSSDCHKSF
jgi:hypothetical protein